ncbi:hypothetical protein QUF70_07530 [Desulfobacterales bacterium HSG17]|nr:hypothetical protein [Desulfobacterales bacterium HSG17]
MKRYSISILMTILSLLLIKDSWAYDDIKTHPSLTQIAVQSHSNLNQILDGHLGINDGLLQIYKGKTVIELLEAGSKEEDRNARALNHFYNPLFDIYGREAALDNLLFNSDISNPEWALNISLTDWVPPEECTEGDHLKDNDHNDYSWTMARNSFYDALTTKDPAEREQHFYNLFFRLGHVLHMIQDMAVPAHTRNDMEVGHLS